MKIPDGELVRLWSARVNQWQKALVALHRHHARSLGRSPGPIHWLGSEELGPWSWFGYFWVPEQFWFGYGFQDGDWRPLIEADTRQSHARSWRQLSQQLPTVWKYEKAAGYLRLWAPAELGESAKAQERWLRDRSQELNDYALG